MVKSGHFSYALAQRPPKLDSLKPKWGKSPRQRSASARAALMNRGSNLSVLLAGLGGVVVTLCTFDPDVKSVGHLRGGTRGVSEDGVANDE
jgi:hypothetical protein